MLGRLNLTICLILLFLFGWMGTVEAVGERIAEISIVGHRRIETDAIKNAVSMKVGDIYFAEKADNDVRAIYKLGHFQDVKAESEVTSKGIRLTYKVVEKQIVRDIKIEGNKELSVDKIKEALELRTNSIFSAKDLSKSIRKIKKLYADDGYYLAEVETSTEKISDTEQRITLKVIEGKKILIQKIQFEGNNAFSRRKLKGVMETTEDWWLSWLTGAGVYKDEMLKNDVNLVTDFYFNNGFVNVKIGEPKVELLPDKSGLTVIFNITEGDKFNVGVLGFKGDLIEKSEDLKKQLKLKTGEVFSRAVLRGDVFNLTDIYADQGYAFANINPMTKLNPEQKTIDITFDMEKGEKVYFDKITIAGNSKTRDKVIRRELKMAEGDLYSATGLKKSKQNLMNLGYFEEAAFATDKGSADNKLNLKVEVKEKPTGTFSIGAGYSSLDGLIGQGSIQQANFLGLGLKAHASASIGGKSQTYNVGITDPYFLDTKWTLGADIYRTDREYLDYKRRVTGGDIKAGYPLSDTISTFWVYRYEVKDIYDVSQAFIKSGQFYEASSTTSAISASLSRNTTDYRIEPSSGMVNSLSVEFAGLGGTNKFLRYIGSTIQYFPVVWGSVFSLRGELGYIQSIGKEIPTDEKFYLGGIGTVRGYNGRTISPYKMTEPRDMNGVEGSNRAYTGGDTETTFSAELTIPLIKEAGLKGVLFYDAGNSYDGVNKLFSSFQTSFGFGIRWFSPMGPLRLEYGIPINPRAGIDSSSGKLEFSIGGFF